MTRQWDGWALSAAATYNDGKAARAGVPLWTFYNADGSGEKVAGSALLSSVARNF